MSSPGVVLYYKSQAAKYTKNAGCNCRVGRKKKAACPCMSRRPGACPWIELDLFEGGYFGLVEVRRQIDVAFGQQGIHGLLQIDDGSLVVDLG
jgi:hypothetical protein